MPAKLERCVAALLARKSFKPGVDAKERKSSAYAICNASIGRNNDLMATILSLPDDVDVSLDETGNIRLSDAEVLLEDAEERLEEDHQFAIGYDEKDKEKDVQRFYMGCKITLAEKRKKTECAGDETDAEGTGEIEEEDQNFSIEMLREGKYKHPWYGDLDFNRKYLLKLIENFLNDVVDREIAFDSSHAPWEGATGWLKTLSLRRRIFKDRKRRYVLTGDVKPTKWGKDLVEGERFKYYSIEVNDKFEDKETGEDYGPTIMGGGLTNRPFIPGMRSIQMSEDVVNAPDQGGEPAPADQVEAEDNPGQQEGQTNVNELLQDLDTLIIELGGSVEADGTVKLEGMTVKPDGTVELAKEKQQRPPDSQLPDAAFAMVKTVDGRKKRALPHHGPQVKSATENSSVDLGRLRNALARWNQVKGFSSQEKAAGLRHLEAHARVLLKTQKARKAAQEGAHMDLQEKIDELRVKLEEMTDKNSDQAKTLSDQIKVLEEAQAKFNEALEAKSKELSDKFSTRMTELEDKHKAAEAELAQIRTEKQIAEVHSFCDQAAQDRHHVSVIKVVREVMLADLNSDASWKLSEDDKEITLKLKDVMKRILDAIPEEARVQKHSELKQNGPKEPEGKTDDGKITLDDGTVVDPLDEESIQKALQNRGYRPPNVQ